jgi:hypothetical protein
MIVINQGKTLAPGDLGINLRDERGYFVDPAYISYSIFSVDPATNVRTLASPPKQVPARAGNGTYYVNLTIPSNWDGRYDLVWYVVQYPNDQERQVYEEFEVVRIDPAQTSFEAPSVLMTSKPGLSPKIARHIMTVRELLSDENPDRNYHFRPPTPGKVVAGFNTRVGYIWTDSTITRMLRLSISQLNTWNPMNWTEYRLENAPDVWADAAAVGAAGHCLGKEAARWAEEEFGYSLNGVSLDINKSATYQSLAESYKSEFQEWAVNLTANRPCSSGLRQNRWILG